jgi:hypothetical protein
MCINIMYQLGLTKELKGCITDNRYYRNRKEKESKFTEEQKEEKAAKRKSQRKKLPKKEVDEESFLANLKQFIFSPNPPSKSIDVRF